MVRKFLYVVAGLIVIYIAGRIALSFWYRDLAQVALVPDEPYSPPAPLAVNAFADPARWLSRPGLKGADPARWRPREAPAKGTPVPAAVFFVHPTSHYSNSEWNARPGDDRARDLVRGFVRGTASPFGEAAEIWAPAYRQATFGAFLERGPNGQRALDAAYADVEAAFAEFVAKADPALPIVLAGHSQGAYHLRRLIAERVAGTPLARRIAAVYAIGWPVSVEHDLPLMQLPACETPDSSGCVVSWASFAEPADTDEMLRQGARTRGLDGQPLAGPGKEISELVCTNPLTGARGGSAPASAGLGTLKPDATFEGGAIVPQLTGATCAPDGSLRIGPGPEMGPFVAPGGNYHVYDIPLFWMNLRADFARRVAAWQRLR